MSSGSSVEVHGSGVVDVASYGRSALRRGWLVAVGLLLGLVAGYGYADSKSPTYVATSSVQVRAPSTDVTQSGTASGALNIDTEQQVASSTAVASLVRNRLGASESPTQLAGRISVASPGKANVLIFSYQAGTPSDAARGVQTWAQAYLDYRATQAKVVIASASANLLASVDALVKSRSSSPDLAGVTTQINSLRSKLATLNGLVVDPGTVIVPATQPSRPAGLPKKALRTAGALVGLVVGLVLAVSVDRLDERVSGRHGAARQIGMPVLAVLSRQRRRDRSRLLGGDDPRYSNLAARLLLLANADGLCTFTLSGPTFASTGVVAGRLAVAIAHSGSRVVLVLADEDDRSVEAALRLRAGPGLFDVLRGTVGAAKVLQTVPGIHGLRAVSAGVTDNRGFAIPPDVVRKALDEWSGTGDIVIVVTPSSTADAPSFVLSASTDAVVLVADTKVSRVRRLRETAHAIEAAGGRVLGVVVSGQPGGLLAGNDPSASPELDREHSPLVESPPVVK